MSSNSIFRDIRNVLNLSQREFADLFGVSKNTVIKWDQGKAVPPPCVPNLMLRTLISEDNDFDKEALIELKRKYEEQEITSI